MHITSRFTPVAINWYFHLRFISQAILFYSGVAKTSPLTVTVTPKLDFCYFRYYLSLWGYKYWMVVQFSSYSALWRLTWHSNNVSWNTVVIIIIMTYGQRRVEMISAFCFLNKHFNSALTIIFYFSGVPAICLVEGGLSGDKDIGLLVSIILLAQSAKKFALKRC